MAHIFVRLAAIACFASLSAADQRADDDGLRLESEVDRGRFASGRPYVSCSDVSRRFFDGLSGRLAASAQGEQSAALLRSHYQLFGVAVAADVELEAVVVRELLGDDPDL